MILSVHNRYRSASPSGENVVQEREQALLVGADIPVQSWLLESDDLVSAGIGAQLSMAWRLSGDASRRAAFAGRLREAKADGIDVIHLHNPWPLFTYDLALAAGDAGIPLVQTVHNYRLIGTNTHLVKFGRLKRPDGEQERRHVKRMANIHGGVANIFYNRALKSWWRRRVPQTAVAAYLCLTPFQRHQMIAAGIPEERTVIVPNFLDHRGPVGDGPGDYALFVGRLDRAKGIDQLMAWWPRNGPPLRIIGDGPLAQVVTGHDRITALGRQPQAEVQRLMAGARLLVMSSTWYEGLPLVLIEALACGTPCLVPDLGGMPSIIQSGVTGLVYPPDQPQAAASAAQSLWEAAPAMRAACRAEYEAIYTPERHLRRLQTVYDAVRAGKAIPEIA
jgi:glycosyltransferase involved in cell wall biosynthesis